ISRRPPECWAAFCAVALCSSSISELALLFVNGIVGSGIVVLASILVLMRHALPIGFRNSNHSQRRSILRNRDLPRERRRIFRAHALAPDVHSVASIGNAC